jgi:hypothetical protein
MNRLTCKKAGMKVIATAFVVLFALGQSGAYAADAEDAKPVKTEIISSVIHVETFYNAFGVAYMSTESTKTTTETSDGETTGTTISTSFTQQTWKGGSIKPDFSTSVSDTTNPDGSGSHTDSRVTYSYDGEGRLAAASGTATTTGTNADGANGESGGNYVSTQTTSYIIKNGQALPSQTTTNTTQYLEGEESGTSTEVTTFTYDLIGGAWHLMQEVSNYSYTSTEGSTQNITTTKTYSRDANGLCTGLSQNKTGTRMDIGSTGGKTYYTLSNYDAKVEWDDQQGFYVSSDPYDWIMDTSEDSSEDSSS